MMGSKAWPRYEGTKSKYYYLYSLGAKEGGNIMEREAQNLGGNNQKNKDQNRRRTHSTQTKILPKASSIHCAKHPDNPNQPSVSGSASMPTSLRRVIGAAGHRGFMSEGNI
jgi:hypothetical protein